MRIKFLFTLFFILSLKCFSQTGELKLLDNINPINPNSTFQKSISNSTYPIILASTAALFTTSIINKDSLLKQKTLNLFGSVLINITVTEILKRAVQRERPFVQHPFIHPYNTDELNRSFPSGHTSNAFAFATSLSMNFSKWYVIVPAYTWACSVGYSRLYLGVHYPTDVLAGAILGSASAFLSQKINKKLFRKKK